MDSMRKFAIFFNLLVFFPALILSQETILYHSKASYYYATDGLGTPKGGCGYGDYGRTINEGDVAVVAAAKLFKGGAGCGACYKITCKETECNTDGVVVVVTDHGGSEGEIDFILSTHAFNKMALPGHEKDLRDYGTVHIEYQRVACQYPGKTLTLQVVEHSHYPSYLAFQFLYVEGIADIVAVELFEEDTLEWKTCRRSYGAIWDIVNPPRRSSSGSLTVRFFLNGSGQIKVKARWVLVPNVIPAFWEPGAVYDTSIQLR